MGYFHRGLCRFELGQFDLARADFDEVLRRKPGLPAALVNRALAYQSMGQLEDALRDLTSALEGGLPETRIFFIRSRIRQQLGDQCGAQQDRREGLRRPPQDEKSWVARGVARLSEDPQAALEDFQQALRWNRRSRTALHNIAHVLSERMDRTEEAIGVLDQLLEIQPDDPAVFVARGVLQARLGCREDAIADAQHALRLPSSPTLRHQIQYQAGCIHALTSRDHPSDAETAVALISQAIRYEPKWQSVAATDPDLDSLRANEQFRSLVSAIRILDKFTFPLQD